MRNPDARSVAAVERLRRRSDFRAAARGVRTAASAFVLQARRRSDDGAARVGFTVSKQVGNAVERNRVRRRLRELVRLSAVATAVEAAPGGAGGALRAGHDYVLIGRRAALALPFSAMMQELDVALGRIHASESGGTGGVPLGLLHEAGSSSRPQQPRRSRKRPIGLSENPREQPRRE